MLCSLMLPRRVTPGPLTSLFVVSLFAAGCQKVPLLAPTGSTITLTSATAVLSATGSTSITAQVLEAAGTPPHSGTHITFTTTLGRIDPAETTTDINGRATATFFASTNNGTATIVASSGGASTGANGALKISVGTAAVGRVSLSANPGTIPSNGGSAAITASVLDLNGSALAAVPVTFSTSAGVLGSAVVNTDPGGVAQTTLTTSVQATVTATVGVQSSSGGTGTGTGSGSGSTGGSTAGQASASVTVNVNPLPTVSISAPAGTLTARSPIVFTLSVVPGANSTAQIRNVNVNFGDGDTIDLGSVTGSNQTVGHRYDDEGTYAVRVTAVDTLGGSTSAATVIVVQPLPPLGVAIVTAQISSGGNTTVTFTATVTPVSATVASYVWDFKDGTQQTTTNNQVVHIYVTGSGVKTPTVTVTTTTGQSATGQTAVNP